MKKKILGFGAILLLTSIFVLGCADGATDADEEDDSQVDFVLPGTEAELLKVVKCKGDNTLSEIALENERYTATIAQSSDNPMWNEWICAYFDIAGKANTNYKIYVNLKTDKAAQIPLKVDPSFHDGNTVILNTEAKKWKTFETYTGRYSEGFSRIYVEIPVMTKDSAVKLSLKNVSFEEVSDDSALDASLRVKKSFYTKASLSDVEFSYDNDVVTAKFKNAANQWDNIVQFNDLQLPEASKMYKVSYKVKAKNATNGFATGVVVNSEFVGSNWTWANTSLDAGVETTVVAYVVNGPHSTKGLASQNEVAKFYSNVADENKMPYLKINISDSIVNEIKVYDFKLEAISLAELPSTPMWHSEGDYKIPGVVSEYNVSPIDMENGTVISIPAKKKICGNMIVVNDKDNPWDTSNKNGTIVTATNFLSWDNVAIDGVSITQENASNELFVFTNTTDKEINLMIEFTDKNVIHFAKVD